MRSPRELVAELAWYASRMNWAGMLVSHPTGARTISQGPPPGDGDVLAIVEGMVKTGGIPVGVIGWQIVGEEVRVYSLMFAGVPSPRLAKTLLDLAADINVDVWKKEGFQAWRVANELN